MQNGTGHKDKEMITYDEMKKWIANWSLQKNGYHIICTAYDVRHAIAAVIARRNNVIALGVFRESCDQYAESSWTVESIQSDQNFNKVEIAGVEDEYFFVTLLNTNAVGYCFTYTYRQSECYPLGKAYTGLESRIRNLVLDLMTQKANPSIFPTRGIKQFIKMTDCDRAFAVIYNVSDSHGTRDYGFEVWEEDGGLRYEEIQNRSDSPCFSVVSAKVIDNKMHIHLCPDLVI